MKLNTRLLILLLLLAIAPCTWGGQYFSAQESDSVFLHNEQVSLKDLQKKLKEAIAKKDISFQGKLHNRIGDYHWYAGDYPRAAEEYYTALAISEKSGDSLEIAQCYRNIGWIYLGQKDHPTAKVYFMRSFKVYKSLGQEAPLLLLYDDLGILYRESKQYDKAIEACKESIRLAAIYQPKSVPTSTISLATTYREMGDYHRSVETYNQAIDMPSFQKDLYNLAYAHIDLGRCYISLKQGEKAVKYILRAREIARQGNFGKVEIEAIRYLGPAYQLVNDYKTAFEYSDMYARLSDSITEKKQEGEIVEMHSRHATEKRENYIKNLKKQRKFTDHKLSQERQFKIVLIVFLVLVLALAFFFFRSFTQKKRANQKLSLTYSELESKNKDIADSINYARQIQQARLPESEQIMSVFPDSFVFFSPRDVVSGDFYWFHESGDKVFFAVADCTGHGIPGAFMSLIGIDTLNFAILEKEMDDPGLILQTANIQLKRTLRQNESEGSTRDGMDISLCVFDKKTKRLSYSGAHRPILMFRDNTLNEIKATKTSIGGLTPNETLFATETMQLVKGDAIYLFSDGFPDQFGGPKNKKYSSGRLKSLFKNMHTLPMNEQLSLVKNEFTTWKGEESQIDDVLIMGIRIG